MATTHDVINQVPRLEDFNAYDGDPVLANALSWGEAAWAEEQCRRFGAVTGSRELLEHARLADQNPPQLHTHDDCGHRIDQVEFHPSYHELMRTGIGGGMHSTAWEDNRPGANVARVALNYLWIDGGTACPITMTHSVIPSLRMQPELSAEWEPRILSREYDPRFVPAEQKAGVTFGMAMTEKQGGSDVRANTTRAVSLGAQGPGGEYAVTGHKWFCSAPMCDAFLTLARTEAGLSCFLVPRWKPDGTPNPFLIQRLKNKLGNRSNASSEIEYRDTWSRMVGEEGRGVATIIEMVRQTRLDVAVGAVGIMRHALVRAIHHCRHRSAFGKRLIEQPLMQNVLADMAVEWEASTLLAMRVARAFDQGAHDERERDFARIATSVAKYWVAKRVTGLVTEALECHGGNGYVQDAPIARMFREAPLGSIWEGSGNVQCLDMLRAMHRSPGSVAAFFAVFQSTSGSSKALDAHVAALQDDLSTLEHIEFRGRSLVERMAVALQAALLIEHAPASVTNAFIASRLDGRCSEYGTLSPAAASGAAEIIERAFPG